MSDEDEKTPRIKAGLLAALGPVIETTRANAVFVYADALKSEPLPLPENVDARVFYVTKTGAQDDVQEAQGHQILRVPNVALTRFGQVKIAIFLALSRGLVERGDTVVCLSGQAASGRLDTLVISEVGREHEALLGLPEGGRLPADVDSAVVERVTSLATMLGAEGREGKPVGALFVVGDSERVKSLSRPIIMNPFQGYPEAERNILDPNLEETVKELCSIDGAFLIRGDGVIETAGAFLKTASQEEFELPRGLGARHHAAAAITSVTDSLAITVSESTGRVSIFQGGRLVMNVEASQAARRAR